jgi:acetolactate decarboxylase
MRDIHRLLLVTVLLITILAVASYTYLSLQENKIDRDVLFQTSTYADLSDGVYDGAMPLKELRVHGDIGIGTYNGLDGEMIEVDGQFYQVKVDGKAYSVDESTKTPFAVVTWFESDKTVVLNEPLNFSQLESHLDSLLPAKNIFYAIRIDGEYSFVKARSVPKQNKPYSPLAVALQNQSTFEFRNIEGTIVGFKSPDYIGGVNVPGYHFHFLTSDRREGGHVLDCQVDNVRIQIDFTYEFYVVLPGSESLWIRTSMDSTVVSDSKGFLNSEGTPSRFFWN